MLSQCPGTDLIQALLSELVADERRTIRKVNEQHARIILTYLESCQRRGQVHGTINEIALKARLTRERVVEITQVGAMTLHSVLELIFIPVMQMHAVPQQENIII